MRTQRICTRISCRLCALCSNRTGSERRLPSLFTCVRVAFSLVLLNNTLFARSDELDPELQKRAVEYIALVRQLFCVTCKHCLLLRLMIRDSSSPSSSHAFALALRGSWIEAMRRCWRPCLTSCRPSHLSVTLRSHFCLSLIAFPNRPLRTTHCFVAQSF